MRTSSAVLLLLLILAACVNAAPSVRSTTCGVRLGRHRHVASCLCLQCVTARHQATSRAEYDRWGKAWETRARGQQQAPRPSLTRRIHCQRAPAMPKLAVSTYGY